MQPQHTRFIFFFIAVAVIGIIVFFAVYSKREEADLTKKVVGRNIEYKKAILETSAGNIEITFYPESAPLTVLNFIKLAKAGFYNGTKFHRVIKDFMIQGGDPLSKDDTKRDLWGTGGPGYTFPDEPNDIELKRGVVAMANAGPDTNGSQFFIITAEATPWLQGKHTAFGYVSDGLDIVDAIERAKTDGNDRPLISIEIEKIILD